MHNSLAIRVLSMCLPDPAGSSIWIDAGESGGEDAAVVRAIRARVCGCAVIAVAYCLLLSRNVTTSPRPKRGGCPPPERDAGSVAAEQPLGNSTRRPQRARWRATHSTSLRERVPWDANALHSFYNVIPGKELGSLVHLPQDGLVGLARHLHPQLGGWYRGHPIKERPPGRGESRSVRGDAPRSWADGHRE